MTKTQKLVDHATSRKSDKKLLYSLISVIVILIVGIAVGITVMVHNKNVEVATPPDFTKLMATVEDDAATGVPFVTFYPTEQLLKPDSEYIVIPLHASKKDKERGWYMFSEALHRAEQRNCVVKIMLKPDHVGELGVILSLQRVADTGSAKDMWNMLSLMLNDTDHYMEGVYYARMVGASQSAISDIVEETYQVRALRAVRGMNKTYTQKHIDKHEIVYWTTSLDKKKK